MSIEILKIESSYSPIMDKTKFLVFPPITNLLYEHKFERIDFYNDNTIEIDIAIVVTYKNRQSQNQCMMMSKNYVYLSDKDKLIVSDIFCEDSIDFITRIYVGFSTKITNNFMHELFEDHEEKHGLEMVTDELKNNIKQSIKIFLESNQE